MLCNSLITRKLKCVKSAIQLNIAFAADYILIHSFTITVIITVIMLSISSIYI